MDVPPPPQPETTKQGMRVFARGEPRIVDVGVRWFCRVKGRLS
jgi:hypothetical protein